MAKRRKPPNIGKPRPTPSPSPKKSGDKKAGSRVVFELEDDAESLFLQEFEGLGHQSGLGQSLADLQSTFDADRFYDEDEDELELRARKKAKAQEKAKAQAKARAKQKKLDRSGGSSSHSGSKSSYKGKKSEPLPEIEIDLHHHSQDEAKQRITHRLAELKALHHRVKVRVITGKGRRSKDGKGVLVRTIHSFVSTKFSKDIESIQPCPSDSTIDGRPIRGYFDVVFKF